MSAPSCRRRVSTMHTDHVVDVADTRSLSVERRGVDEDVATAKCDSV